MAKKKAKKKVQRKQIKVADGGVVEIMVKLKVSWPMVDLVRKKNNWNPPDSKRKTHIGARFDGQLTKKVLAECVRLGITRNDFLEMVTRVYFKERGGG